MSLYIIFSQFKELTIVSAKMPSINYRHWPYSLVANYSYPHSKRKTLPRLETRSTPPPSRAVQRWWVFEGAHSEELEGQLISFCFSKSQILIIICYFTYLWRRTFRMSWGCHPLLKFHLPLWVQFCLELKVLVKHTVFCKLSRRKNTWGKYGKLE